MLAASRVSRKTRPRGIPIHAVPALPRPRVPPRGGQAVPTSRARGDRGAAAARRSARTSEPGAARWDHVFDVVAPSLPRPARGGVAAHRRGPARAVRRRFDGSHLLRVAGPDRLPERFEVPLAIGPELDSAGLAELRAGSRTAVGRGRPALAPRARDGHDAHARPARSPLAEIAARPRPRSRSPTATPIRSRGAGGARSRVRRPRSSRACSRPASPGSAAVSWPATCCPATRSQAIGSTSSRTSTGCGSPRRRPRSRRARRREQRGRARRAARQPAQRRQHPRGADAHAPDAARDARPSAEMTAIVARWDPPRSSSRSSTAGTSRLS